MNALGLDEVMTGDLTNPTGFDEVPTDFDEVPTGHMMNERLTSRHHSDNKWSGSAKPARSQILGEMKSVTWDPGS